MTRVAIKSLSERRFRTVLTALAIVLGVAMIAGAYTLTDTMGNAASSLSKASYDGTDAVVSVKPPVARSSDDNTGDGAPLAASVVDQVRRVNGVESAAGNISDQARIVGKDGKVDGTGPYFGQGIDAHAKDASRLTPFKLREGRFASSGSQVVIDAGTAKRNKLAVDDRVRIQTHGPARAFTVSGIATFGGVNSIGKATFAVFDVRSAQTLFHRPGQFTEVLVAGDGSVSPNALRRRIAAQLSPRLQVQSAAANDRFTLDGLKSFVKIIRTVLVAFGFIAIFVGAFTIMNTLSITVAQRSRELAMLRTMGASRRQVLRSVVLEAFGMGVIASIVGLAAGVGLASLLQSVLSSAGIDLPQTGLVFAARTVILSLLIGVVVTVLAGLGPAMRATRVSPITVLREGAEIPPSRIGRHAPLIAVVVTVVALAILAIGLFAGGINASGRLALLAPGALLLFVGVALVSPRLVRPLASVLGAPARRFGGSAGALARQNSMRNPGRTASTAAALMIGIALVAFVAVLGQGMKQATRGNIRDSVRGNFVVVGQDNYSPVDPAVTAAAAKAPGVQVASGVSEDVANAFGKRTMVDAVDPATIARVYGTRWKQGSDATLAKLRLDGAVVTDKFAADHHLKAGSPLRLRSSQGKQVRLTVAGVTNPGKFNALNLGQVTIAKARFDGAFTIKRQRFAFIEADAGAGPALKRTLAPYPDAKVTTADQFAVSQSSFVDQILGIFYVLLGLCVLVSLFGIVNTLALSVLERTRELGMLKAIGMTRRQVRRMVRHESVITALIGAVLGIAVGVFMAALSTAAMSSLGLGFSLPVGALIAFTIVAIVAGMLAAIVPARRAARLNVLSALQYE